MRYARFLLKQLDYSFLYGQIGALCLVDFEKYKNVEGEIYPEFERTRECSQTKRWVFLLSSWKLATKSRKV